MSTRSLIAIEKDINVYDCSYCHFDGYPNEGGVGTVLGEHYLSEEKVVDLLSKGDMSFLKAEVDECEFYTKRGEALHVIKNVSFEKIKHQATNVWAEYIYVYFPAENCWQYFDSSDNFCHAKNMVRTESVGV